MCDVRQDRVNPFADGMGNKSVMRPFANLLRTLVSNTHLPSAFPPVAIATAFTFYLRRRPLVSCSGIYTCSEARW